MRIDRTRGLLLAALLLFGAALACNFPAQTATPMPVATMLAKTAAAILTQTAAVPSPVPPTETQATSDASEVITPTPVIPPTSTPDPNASPTPVIQPSSTDSGEATPGPGNCTDDSEFVSDVTVPDGTEFEPDVFFTKTWRVRNSGTCTWGAGYTFVHTQGPSMSAPTSIPLPAVVLPGEEINISVNFTSPTEAGTHRSYWRIQNPDGTTFGTRPYAEIVVTP